MKPKYPATALKQLALSGGLVGFEARAFAAFHSAVLDGSNHLDYVEAFALQLDAPEQHEAILSLLSACGRTFAHGKIAYKPPGARQLTSVLDVGRWVSSHLFGGLAHTDVRSPLPPGRRRRPQQSAAHVAQPRLPLLH